METMTVAVAAGTPSNVDEFLLASGLPVQVRRLTDRTEEYLVEALADVDAVVFSSREAVTPRVMAAMKRCRVMSRRGVGVDNLDVEAATRHGLAVACVPDASVEEVSDHAVALLLACARRIVWLNDTVKSGKWGESGASALAPVRKGG
jgi:phosphoglycerate dehydrogenase-like enzyme